MKYLKNPLVILLIGIVIGFAASRFQKPEKIESETKVSEQQKIIAELESKVKFLESSKKDERVVETITEKADGTKVTTRTIEKTETKRVVSNEEKQSNSRTDTSRETEQKVTTTFSSNRNAIGFRGSTALDAEVFLETGMECLFVLRCYAEASYNVIDSGVKATVGLKFTF